MLNEVEIIEVVIVLEFTLSAVYAVTALTDVLIGALPGVIIDVALGMGLADANVNVLTAVMTASEFVMPAPLVEPMLSC